MLTQKEIERRKPLWLAYSDLWFAGNKGKFEYAKIVKAMISSDYDLHYLEKICFEEVAPVLYTNLYYDDWFAIDEDWFYEETINNLKKQRNNPIYRIWVKSNLGKFVMTKMVQDDWGKIVELYKSKLAEKENP